MAVATHPGAMAVRAPGTAPTFAIASTRKVALRRVAGKVAQAAVSEKHTITALAAAGALGLAERNDIPIPYIEMLGKAGTLGAVAWIAGRFTGNNTMQHVATGLLSVAVHELAKGKPKAAGGGVAGDNEVIMGEI